MYKSEHNNKEIIIQAVKFLYELQYWKEGRRVVLQGLWPRSQLSFMALNRPIATSPIAPRIRK